MVSFHRLIPTCDVLGTTYCVTEVVEFGNLLKERVWTWLTSGSACPSDRPPMAILEIPRKRGGESTTSAWVYGLQQNTENRTNLAIVNTGLTDRSTDVFTIELYDGNTGIKVATVQGISLAADAWMQIGTILAQYAPGTTQGYARVTRTSGTNPFIVYAVINDGGQPGERSGDGAFISSSP